MERSLNPDLLGLALGEHEALPSPEELSQLLANAELALLLYDQDIPDELMATGWYLHGIASSKYALRTYEITRHRAAFEVAGHIFDLKLQTRGLPSLEKFKYCFAAQVAYARSSLDPNSLALYRREYSGRLNEFSIIPDFQLVSLSCGVSFLGFDVRYVYQLTSNIEKEVDSLVRAWEINDIGSTMYGAVANVASGTRDLMSFLVYGRDDLLERARQKLRAAITAEASVEDDLSRWVAAHLLNFSDNLEGSTIWNVLPPGVPTNVRKAFVNGEPHILTLWPPQIDFLGIESGSNPLSDNVKRLLLSTPTSGGKTLVAQLLLTAHLSTKATSVCYVAPTRSLCREVRQSLQTRLRFIGRQIIDGLPEGAWFNSILDSLQPEVEVMTPERLSYLLRTDSGQVLNRFGLFIFDEVHLVGDESRGWTLEEDLSFLHYATENLHHKIVLISAAIGNRNHIIQWLSRENDDHMPLDFHSDWRGPRRIHAVWTTDAFWNDSIVTRNNRARKYFYNKTTPLYGRLDVRVSHTGLANTFHTENPVGELVQKAEKGNGQYIKDPSSTPFYRMLVPIINYLAEFGPVLTIEATKPATIRLAEAIAEAQGAINNQPTLHLIDLVTARLGAEHPLKRVLEKGVAYHHGSLPSEIRSALEEAVSSGYLKHIVATTTLTEGINLPVTSVVIASQGAHGEEGFKEYITGSKLVNAIGRAGRATKETEGIVVLARQAQLSTNDFDRLRPSENDLHVSSMLATEKALDALAIFEELYRVSEDAVFETHNSEITSFLKFVWFISSELEKLAQALAIERIEEVLKQTLGWVQLDPSNRSRWLQAANVALNQYRNTEESVRRRWASSGTSIGSSRVLEHITRNIVSDLEGTEIPQGIIEATELIIANNRLQEILQLPEAKAKTIYTKRGRNRNQIDVSTGSLLIDWLRGKSLIEISQTYFEDVEDIDFRFEQLGDFINSRFEVFLPWAFGTLISWVNEMLLERESDSFLPTSVPANIRYGVDNSISLELMIQGVQSRQLAIKIADAWQAIGGETDVIPWIRSLSLTQWAELFDASPNEIRNLLEISRVQRGGVVVDLFNIGQAELTIGTEQKEYVPTEVTLQRIGDSEFAPVGVWDGNNLVGTIFSGDQSDIVDLMNTGIAFLAEYSVVSGNSLLNLRLIEPE
jgi:superfamily II DNA/RNA helicase